jgi:hypothetical protein
MLLFLIGLRARSLSALSMKSVGAAGAAVGCVLHWWVIGGPTLEPLILTSLVLGAGCGIGTLALARRAERLASPAEQAQLPAA